jgi:hypothetical protein
MKLHHSARRSRFVDWYSMDWRKLKAGDRVFVFPNRYPCIVISVGKPEGRALAKLSH